jgi:hypothetical protein
MLSIYPAMRDAANVCRPSKYVRVQVRAGDRMATVLCAGGGGVSECVRVCVRVCARACVLVCECVCEGVASK